MLIFNITILKHFLVHRILFSIKINFVQFFGPRVQWTQTPDDRPKGTI